MRLPTVIPCWNRELRTWSLLPLPLCETPNYSMTPGKALCQLSHSATAFRPFQIIWTRKGGEGPPGNKNMRRRGLATAAAAATASSCRGFRYFSLTLFPFFVCYAFIPFFFLSHHPGVALFVGRAVTAVARSRIRSSRLYPSFSCGTYTEEREKKSNSSSSSSQCEQDRATRHRRQQQRKRRKKKNKIYNIVHARNDIIQGFEELEK